MKQKLIDIILFAANRAYEKEKLLSKEFPFVEIEEPKVATFGDFSTNIALVMASVQKMPPRKIAEAIKEEIEDADGMLDRVEIAGPGFINFFVNPKAWLPVLQKIHEDDMDSALLTWETAGKFRWNL